jgi:hypothetical protein
MMGQTMMKQIAKIVIGSRHSNEFIERRSNHNIDMYRVGPDGLFEQN